MPRDARQALKKGLNAFIKTKVKQALKGGSGYARSPAGKSGGAARGGAKKAPSSRSKAGAGPSRQETRAEPASTPEIIFNAVKQAATARERDWTPPERDDLAWKTRMLRRWLRTSGGAPLEIDPAHGNTDLPRVSSQAGFAAVYEWMEGADIDLSSPLEGAYKAIWQEQNTYNEVEKIKLQRLVEEIDVQLQRGDLQDNPAGVLLQKLRENKSPGEISALLADEVRFAAFHPKEAKVDKWYTMLVYAHLESAWEAVQRDAGKFEEEIGVSKQVRSAEAARLPRGTAITVAPSCEGVEFDPEQVTFHWLEDSHRAQFRLRGSPALAEDAAKGKINIYANSLLVGALKFAMLFSEKEPPPAQVEWDQLVRGKMLLESQIFISYSHADQEVVELVRDFIRGLGYRTLMDIDDLRAAQLWEKGLMSMIEQADIFQLFWSKNSAMSRYVRREWRYALKCKKALVPVYWQKPLSPDPPKELKSIQFGYLPIAKFKS